MDLSTLIGIVLGLGLVGWGIMQSGSIGDFIHMPSLAIVLGGTIAATMVSFPLNKLLNAGKVTKNVFFEKKYDYETLIGEIIGMANIARKEGLFALEETSEKTENEFLKKGIMMVVDGTDPELVRSVMETELNFLEERHKDGQKLFEVMGALCPAFGMVGTLIGLINMLGGLSDVSSVGPNMSVALITTFYGSLFANLFFTPFATKLKDRNASELLAKEMMLEGLLSTQAGENPRLIEEKLYTFLAPSLRKKLEDKREG